MAMPGFALQRVQTCGGLARPDYRGPYTISGVAKIDATPAPCRVFLHDQSGTLLGFRRTGADGAYAFLGLQPGRYRLVIEDDMQTARRSKVEHVVLG